MDSVSGPVTKEVMPSVLNSEKYAGVGIRLGAVIIDSIVLNIIQFIMSLPFGANLALTAESDTLDSGNIITIIIYYVAIVAVTAAYFIVLETSNWQGTVGKKALGIKIVNEEGGKISIGQSIGRYFARGLSSILLIGYIIAFSDEKKQTLHDRLARTYVVSAK